MPFVSSVRGNFTASGKRPSFPATGSTGGTITTAGGYRIHTFTTTGASTFTFNHGAGEGALVEYLVIGGGGGGGPIGGGGGAGGFVSGSRRLAAGATSVTVGTPGPAGPTVHNDGGPVRGQNGGPSTLSTITAIGGGGGGGWSSNAGSPGGSGGGGTNAETVGGTATQPGTSNPGSTQNAGHPGFGGGNAVAGSGSGTHSAGGGGGAGSTGPGRMGGVGLTSSISGSSVGYAGGGGGGSHGSGATSPYTTTIPAWPSPFGAGFGGSVDSQNGIPGTATRGSGGGGSFYPDGPTPGNGSSGIVIVRYLV